MKELDILGSIEFEGKRHQFSLREGFLTLLDPIVKPELMTMFPIPDYSLDVTFGYTLSGQSICFLDSRLVSNDREQIFSPRAVVISYEELTKDTVFHSIRITGGSLNQLGDVIKEIFYTVSEGDRELELEKYEKGIATFKYNSFEETNANFTDDESDDKHKYLFSVNRHFYLTEKNIKNFNRSFFLHEPYTFYPH